MSETGCHNCYGACCIGPQTMQLTLAEKEQMESAGSLFQTIAEPADHDREKVRYPIDFIVDKARNSIRWMYKADRPFEPLPAGYGRYMLIGACGNLLSSGQCGIYDDRPQVCRDFVENGSKCVLMREVKVELGRRLLPGLKH